MNIERNETSLAQKLFWAFCTIHVFFWTLLPSLLRHNVPFDTIEGIAWGNQWQFGYDKHPPLAAWLSALATYLGGITGWPVYLLAQLAVFATFWAVWRLANRILTPLQSLASVLLLEGVIYYGSSITVKFNPTTLMSPIWAITILVFYLALTTKNKRYWLLTGLFAGLSLLAKYESGLLLMSMFLFLLVTEEGRKSFKDKGAYIAFFASIIIFLPNLIWLYYHHFSELSYAVGSIDRRLVHSFWRDHTLHAAKFALAQLIALVPIFIMAIPFYFAAKESKKSAKFDLTFLLMLGFGPFFLTLVISLFTGCFLYAKWATPYFAVSGIVLIMLFRPVITRSILRLFLLIVIAVMALQIGLRYSYIVFAPSVLHMTHYADAYFPGQEIGNKVTTIWRNKYNLPLKYVAGDHYLMANINAYSGDHPIPYFSWSKSESAWIDEKDLRKHGAIFAWPVNKKNRLSSLPLNIRRRFKRAKYFAVERFASANKHVKPVSIAIYILPPKKNV